MTQIVPGLPYGHVTHVANARGRDYFVGDLHGCYDQLINRLDQLEFDKAKDRLFAVGDLIDRGEQPLECLRLINKPWFYSVIGNHEEMFFDALVSDSALKPLARQLHYSNGGAWAEQLSDAVEHECRTLIQSLPLARTVVYREQRIGIVHAGWGWHWDALTEGGKLPPYRQEFATWARLDHPYRKDHIAGVDCVVSGHQNTTSIERRGNQLWIDTVGKTEQLTLVEAGELLSIISTY